MFSNNYGPRSHTNSNNDVDNLKSERKIIPYKQHGIQLLSYTRCIFIVSDSQLALYTIQCITVVELCC